MQPTDQWERDHARRPSPSAQGVAVTPLQMAEVYATIANGGMWVQPRLVRATVAPTASSTPAPAAPRHRVCPPDQQEFTGCSPTPCRTGPATRRRSPGYQVAGKTGTAKKVDATGRYIDRYMASFIGFLPASQPKVVIAAILDEPDTVYGGVAAAPLFQHVARYAIQRLGIGPSAPVALPPHRLAAP